MPPKTKTTDTAPARAEATCSHYLLQPDGTFVTYGRGSVLVETDMSAESWESYLDDGRLLLTDRPAIRMDPEDGYYMEPVSPLHKTEG